MKTKSVFLLAALAVVSLFSVSCSSDEDLTANVEEERGVVKTEFTIAFPRKAVEGTRMAGGTVQLEPSDFRGISEMKLYPFRADNNNIVIDKDTKLEFTQINLFDGSAQNILATSNAFYQSTNSHLYQDVDIPLGTNIFLFYGIASKTNELASAVGKLDATLPSVDKELSQVKFSPSPICETPPVETDGELKSSSNGGSLATYLTSIADAKAADDNVWASTLNVPLKSLYEEFITMKAGSWTNAMAAVSKIYEGVKTPLTSDNEKTQALKTAIKTAILANSNVSEVTGEGLSFGENAFGGYPKDLGLPDGAAYINWKDDAFHELSSNQSTGLNMGDFNRYAYPAELYYHVISGIKTSKASKSSLYTGATGFNSSATTAASNWNTLLENYTDEVYVTSKTRAIAIVKQVQYAVGRLDVKVQATMPSLTDNSGTTVTIGTNTFKVTGLLVNGQKAVDYKFNQISSEPAYTLYDNIIKDKSKQDVYMTTSESNAFYTLVLETPEYGDDETSKTAAKVRIAVEFENNSGKTLVGRDGGLIYPGTKFYLIGTLDPSLNDGASTEGHTSHKDADNELIKKAFKQDYNTTVTLKVSDLTKAYNVLPDLALPRLEMGLSIDVDWKQGIIQDLTIE